jgi:hypothetical protein
LALLGDDLAHLVDASVADEQLEVIPRGCEHDGNVLAPLVADETPVAFIVASRSGLAAAKCKVALPAKTSSIDFAPVPSGRGFSF